MISLIVGLFSSRHIKSKLFFDLSFKCAKLFYAIRGTSLIFDANRFKNASWIKSPTNAKSGNFTKRIELILVSTSKDFDILRYSVQNAIRSLSKYDLYNIKIIVPSRDVKKCLELFADFPSSLDVVNEELLVSQEQFDKLTECFGNRNTWVLQQLLKVQTVLHSESDAVLIVDSDTILLRKRPWFDQYGRQLLMPSYEYNFFYYDFLYKLGISEISPKFSLTSHHMIMQPQIFRDIFSFLRISSISELIEISCREADTTAQSPICLDYDLYGQFLVNHKPKAFFFDKWANLTIPKRYSNIVLRSKILQFMLRSNFNSVSFHSWS